MKRGRLDDLVYQTLNIINRANTIDIINIFMSTHYIPKIKLTIVFRNRGGSECKTLTPHTDTTVTYTEEFRDSSQSSLLESFYLACYWRNVSNVLLITRVASSVVTNLVL